MLLGMPLNTWARIGNFNQTNERIADLGCGPSDILRFVDKKNKPAFYLGVDISEYYLRRAAARARKMEITAEFIRIDLNQLSTEQAIQQDLVNGLLRHQITTVNLFGVIHHIDDESAICTLNTVYEASSVQSLNTEDVLIIKGNVINNFYASLDRGEYVRTEDEYDALLSKSRWKSIEKVWSHAGVWPVKYLHYRLSK